MSKIIKQYIEGDLKISEFESGTIIKEPAVQPAPKAIAVEATLEDKINYLYYKSKGVIS